MTTKDSSDTAIDADSSVTLGERITITATSTDTALGSNFYLSDCTATNGEDKFEADGTTSNSAYKELQLVKSGCMSNLTPKGATLNAAISPEMTGQSLSFNQFAFADSTQSKFIIYLFLI